MAEGKAADGAEETAPRDDGSTTESTESKPPATESTKEPKVRSGSSSRTSKDSKDARGSAAKGSVDQIRSTVATVVWVVAVLCALVLAAGALVVALDFNPRNDAVQFLTDTAEKLNFLGDLKTFKPDGRSKDAIQSAHTKEVLVNWGICALVYLVGGKILDRVIRP
jgi:hypothetical protein